MVAQFLRWALHYGFIVETPGIHFYPDETPAPVHVPRNVLQCLLTKLESGKIETHHQSKDWWVLLLRLFHYTGFRRNELLTLRWDAVDSDEGRLTVIVADGNKKKRPSSCLLDPDNLERLRAWHAKCQREQPVLDLVLPRKIKIRTVCSEFESIREQAGLPTLCFQHLRSTCATENATQFGTAVAQKHLRHVSPATTARYYIADDPAQRRAAEGYQPL